MLLNKLDKTQRRILLIPKLNDSASSTYKILAKVPLWFHFDALIQVPVHGMGTLANDFDFRKDREVHIVVVFDKSCNAAVSQRLLFAELVARECQYAEVLIIKI